MKGWLNRAVLLAQGAYYVATGLWPFVHERSFLSLSGDKPDRLQFHTAALPYSVIGAALVASALERDTPPEPIFLLALGTAASNVGVEAVYFRGLPSALKAEMVPELLFIFFLIATGGRHSARRISRAA